MHFAAASITRGGRELSISIIQPVKSRTKKSSNYYQSALTKSLATHMLGPKNVIGWPVVPTRVATRQFKPTATACPERECILVSGILLSRGFPSHKEIP